MSFEKTTDLLEKLVSFDTVSRNSNMQLIDFLRAYLNNLGVTSHLVPNEDGSKANLYATIGPDVPGGVVLSGHTDVVPIDDQDWTVPPFELTKKEDRLYGRGTCDMKGFVAIACAAVPTMLEKPLSKPIHLAFSYDEEIGCVGAPDMINEIVSTLPPIDAVIVGEPTNMQVANMHKGILAARTHICGLEAHSSQTHRGVSANAYAARLITFIDDINREFMANPHDDLKLAPPHSTINVGLINGGIAANIIARDCKFTWDFRSVPHDNVDETLERIQTYAATLETEMQQSFDGASINLDIRRVPGLNSNDNDRAAQLCMRLAGKNDTIGVPYGTEAGQFQQAGYSTVVCGPGSIDQAHKPDEYVEIEQLKLGAQFVDRLIDDLTN